MRSNQRRPAPSLVAIAVVLIASAVAALAVAASGDRTTAVGRQDRVDRDPVVAHWLVVERALATRIG